MTTLDDVVRENQYANATLREITLLLGGILDKSGGKGGADEGKSGKGLLAEVAKDAAIAATAIGALTYSALHFVKALNPGLAAQFGQEVKNLTATIGHALTPIIQTAIPIVRQLSAIFLDLSQELRPIIADLSDAIGAELIAIVRAASVLLKVLLAVLEPLVRLINVQMNYVAQFIELFTALVKTLVDFYSELLRSTGIVGTVGDAFKEFIHWINRTAGVLANLAARILVFFGAASAVAAFRKNLLDIIKEKTNPKGGLLAAPEGARTSGIEEIAKRFSEKAFIASSATGGAKKTDVEFLEEIARGLEKGLMGRETWEQVIITALSEFFPKIPKLGDATERGLTEIYGRSVTAGAEVVDRFGLDDAIPSVFGSDGLLSTGKPRKRRR